MRIGQVNQDNYKAYLELLGTKNPKSLGKFLGDDKMVDWVNKDNSSEAVEARLVAAGLATKGMVVHGNDESWKKIVDVPDSVKQAIMNYSRELFIINDNGTMTEKQGNDLSAVYSGYIESLSPSERLSAFWTCQKIFQTEAERINNYIKSQVPGWATTQSFDTSILTKTNYGLGFDVKA